jgi:hypothetical protein
MLRPEDILPIHPLLHGIFRGCGIRHSQRSIRYVSPVQLPILVDTRGQPSVLGVSLGSIQHSRLKVNAKIARLANTVLWVRRRVRRLALHARLANPVTRVRRIVLHARLANTVLLAGLALHARLAHTVTPWVRRRAQIVQRPVQFHIFPVQIWMTVGVDRGMKRDTMTNVMYVVWVAFPVNQVQHANNVP